MRIDFYILSDDSPNARDQLSCRLAEKAWKAGHSVYLHTGSAPRAAELDELLWMFRDGSFVPHARAGDRPGPETPVVIGGDEAPPPGSAVLINLASAVPPFYAQFERVAEIVEPAGKGREHGRARYRFYRDQGLQPNSHHV